MQFVILTQARSGSYHLADLLNSAPDITCFGEIFKANAFELPKPRLDFLGLTNRDMAARDADPMGILNRLRKQVHSEGQIFGFKDFLYNLRRAKIYGQIAKNDKWKKIILLRNPIARYISRTRAAETGVYVLKQQDSFGQEVLEKPIRFDPDDFNKFWTNDTSFMQAVEAIKQTASPDAIFTAHYDRLSDPAHLAEILTFLGSTADATTLTSSHLKQFNRPLSEGVENWHDFTAYLAQHHLSHLIP
jgi:hypothetical protein